MRGGVAERVLQATLARGVREYVVCAGARNVPLVLALARAEGVHLWSHFEERSAGFFALGRSADSGWPCAVVTTSGTAVAELLPAVVEVVLVKPTEAEPFDAAHSALHAELAVAEVIVGELRLARNDNGVAGDVNGWTTPDAMEEMGPLMMAKPELAPVFDPANEMLLFMPFATNVVA